MTSVLSNPNLYSQRVTLVAGVGGAPFYPNLNGSSKLLSIRRITVGGTAGTPVASKIRPSGAGGTAVWGLEVFSSNALDTSTYDVTWVNNYIPSQYLTQGGALAGAQFSP